MKFKAFFKDNGLRLLEKNFLPCFEKHGKNCQVLLGPDDIFLIQTTSDTDGMHITARLGVDVLFEADYKCISRYRNMIAFRVEIALLLRVLKAASSSEADSLEMKLAMRPVPVAGDVEPMSRPFLSFASKGDSTSMIADLPISKPFQPAEIDDLMQEKDISQVCPYYLDLQGELQNQRLQGIVDKLKSIGSSMGLTTTQHGCLYLQVSSPGVQLATEVQGLEIVPAGARAESDPNGHSSPQGRLKEALRNDEAHAVTVQLKQFARSLHSSQVAGPEKLLCGIAEGGGHVHFMFVFRDPMSDAGYDDSIALSFKLPVRDDN